MGIKKFFIGVLVGIILTLGIEVAVYFLFIKDADAELQIENTANVVTGIRKISEFNIITFYEELVLSEKKEGKAFFGQINTSNEIVIVAKGKVRAGFDFSKMKENDIVATGDTLTVNVPPAEIFDIIANPSDFDIFIEDGEWSHEEVTKIENRAKAKLEEDALNGNILGKANEKGPELLVSFFKSFGFNVVNVNIKDSLDDDNASEAEPTDAAA